MSDRQAGIALVLVAALSVQFGAAFAVTLFDELGAGGTAFLRLFVSALILLAVWRPRLRGVAAADVWAALLFGVAVGLMNWTFYASIERIPLGPAVTITFLGPLGVAVAGSRHPRDVAWVALAAAGILALARPWQEGGDLDALGVALAVAAGACWAAYIVLSARTGGPSRAAAASRSRWASAPSSRSLREWSRAGSICSFRPWSAPSSWWRWRRR